MGTSREDLKRWFKDGVERGYSYMIVVCDTFDYGDFPVYTHYNDFWSRYTEYKNKSMNRIMEVYNLKWDMDEQIENTKYVFNTPEEEEEEEEEEVEDIEKLTKKDKSGEEVRILTRIIGYCNECPYCKRDTTPYFDNRIICINPSNVTNPCVLVPEESKIEFCQKIDVPEWCKLQKQKITY